MLINMKEHENRQWKGKTKQKPGKEFQRLCLRERGKTVVEKIGRNREDRQMEEKPGFAFQKKRTKQDSNPRANLKVEKIRRNEIMNR